MDKYYWDFDIEVQKIVSELEKSIQKETIKQNLEKLMNLLIDRGLSQNMWKLSDNTEKVERDWFGRTPKTKEDVKKALKRMLEIKIHKKIVEKKDWPAFLCIWGFVQDSPKIRQSEFLFGEIWPNFDIIEELNYEDVAGEEDLGVLVYKGSELFRMSKKQSLSFHLLTQILKCPEEIDEMEVEQDVIKKHEAIAKRILKENQYVDASIESDFIDAALDLLADDIIQRRSKP